MAGQIMRKDLSDQKCIYCGHEGLVEIAKKPDGVKILECQNCNQLMAEGLKKDNLLRLSDESNEEIIALRTEVFRLRDELYSLNNSKIVGSAIRLRKLIRPTLMKIRRIPRFIFNKIRPVVAKFLPAPFKKSVKASYRRFRRFLKHGFTAKPLKIRLLRNEKWESGQPLVSVIIPYFNRAKTIDDTLQSLKGQTLQNFEIILIDDGSNESSSVQKLLSLERETHLNIVHQKNQGVSAARNHGIKLSKGKYIICLDSDDMLDPTFIEKCTVLLETCPDVGFATTSMQTFGVSKEAHFKNAFDPLLLYEDNMVITAAEFRKEAWSKSGGYKSDIGYEDWEYWLSLAENGYFGRLIPELLFWYQVSMQSRYVEDKYTLHWNNIKKIHSLHPKYRKRIKHIIRRLKFKDMVEPDTAFINLDQPNNYLRTDKRPNVLITIPWMTFGGAETLIYNFCREVKSEFNFSFVTGLSSKHEWEYKFKEITPNIYHLTNLFEDPKLHIGFISNYIHTRGVEVLHIIHNGFTFEMLPEIKRRHPSLKVVVSMFNDRVAYFQQSIKYHHHIDVYVTDNERVASNYRSYLPKSKKALVIPNGIDCYNEFNPDLFDRDENRKELGIRPEDLAVFFIGRLSEEKNPDVFLKAAKQVADTDDSTRFFIIGDGPLKPKIERQINNLKSRHIVYLGYKPMVANFLRAADVFVLPSSIEGFPLSILEAMAMEVAVVASKVGAIPDIIKNEQDGIIVKPGSSDEIIKAITKLQKDRAILQNMKKQARDSVVDNYSNRLLRTNYQKLYDEVIQK